MSLLLGDSWAPVTSEVGFIEGDASELAAFHARWLDGLAAASSERPTQVTELSGALETNLAALLPLTKPLRQRFLFQSTDSAWTAYFDNGTPFADAASLSRVARDVGCRAVRVVAIVDSGPSAPRRGAAIWELYGPTKTEFLNYVRTVSLANDGGKWRFDVGGTPQPFEETERYQAKRMRDRFDVEMLERYLGALGIRAFDESFYVGSGWLVDAYRDAMARNVEVTLAEARGALGLDTGPA